MGLKNWDAIRKRAEAIEHLRINFEVEPLHDVIKEHVRHAWVATGYDPDLSAALLDISRSTFYRYLRRYNLDEWTIEPEQ